MPPARFASTLVLLVRHGVTPTTGRLLPGRRRGGTIVVASHADPIKTLVAHALGTPLDLFQRIMIAPASITAIAYRFEGLSVLTMNAMDGDLASLGRP